MEVMVTTGAIRYAKLQSDHNYKNQNQAFYRPVTQPTVSEHLNGKLSHFMSLLTYVHLGVFQSLLLLLRLLITLWRVAIPLISPLTPVPKIVIQNLVENRRGIQKSTYILNY